MTKYNNSLHSFSVNDKVFESLNNEIISNKKSLIPQPVVIIGQQGAGKTTLLKRLYESYPDDKRIWIDGRTIFDSSDIIDSHDISKKNLLFIDDINYYFTRSSYEDQYKLRGFLYNEKSPMMIASMSRVIPAISEYEAPFFEGLKIVYLHTD
ncbi:MAG: ATP-binding cassette domain-containing protein, partial [Muribaculaceae bacterium]|nr:ATP-binding cassette domain-containing protein [Muribaculaceae bacterium]